VVPDGILYADRYEPMLAGLARDHADLHDHGTWSVNIADGVP
jgi:hypothetical protein